MDALILGNNLHGSETALALFWETIYIDLRPRLDPVAGAAVGAATAGWVIVADWRLHAVCVKTRP